MSYNIDTCKIKKLENLVIPLSAFFKHERKDWHPKMVADAENPGQITLECGCGQEIVGLLTNKKLAVTGMSLSGEGSGTFMDWILEPALKESTGQLEAVFVWEGGDSITRLTVKDGVVENSPVDL